MSWLYVTGEGGRKYLYFTMEVFVENVAQGDVGVSKRGTKARREREYLSTAL